MTETTAVRPDNTTVSADTNGSRVSESRSLNGTPYRVQARLETSMPTPHAANGYGYDYGYDYGDGL